MLQDVSTTATLPIRNYDSIKRHIFSIRSTLCAASRREPSILPTDLGTGSRLRWFILFPPRESRFVTWYTFIYPWSKTLLLWVIFYCPTRAVQISREMWFQRHNVTMLRYYLLEKKILLIRIRTCVEYVWNWVNLYRYRKENWKKKRKQMKRIIMRWISSGRSMWIL